MNRLTVGILTLNEERRIEACIRSCAFADEIIVVDSGSRDRTCELAQALGAQVFVHADWKGFAEQRNRLLSHATGDYIFFLDADEQMTPPLVQEIRAAVAGGEDAVWEVRWDQVAYGRPLSAMSSTGGVLRMFRRTSIERFEGGVHEHASLTPGHHPQRRFKTRLLHYSRETVYGSILKLAQYTQLGAAKRAKTGARGGVMRGIASALGSFIRLYIFRRGFLCGAEGFLFCFCIALESFFRYAALRYDTELHDTWSRRS